jgi:uncharacterized membrane protein YbhN (UPF0104 family)
VHAACPPLSPDLSLPVRRIHLLAACAAFLENLTLTESLYAILSSADGDKLRFLLTLSMGHLLISLMRTFADVTISAELGSARLLRQMKARDLRFSVAGSAA